MEILLYLLSDNTNLTENCYIFNGVFGPQELQNHQLTKMVTVTFTNKTADTGTCTIKTLHAFHKQIDLYEFQLEANSETYEM